MSHRLNFKKKEEMLAETKFFFPNVKEWFFVRKGTAWIMKMSLNDPAGHYPTQRIRFSRRRKKRNRQSRA